MGQDKPLKTAYEIAMERLRAQDRAEGTTEAGPLTEEQKREIARLRQETKAKLAELEILHRDELRAAAGDPERIARAEETYRADRARVEARLESAIARVRRGESAEDDEV